MQWKKKSVAPWPEILFVLGLFPLVGGVLLLLDQIAAEENPYSFSSSISEIIPLIIVGVALAIPFFLKLLKSGDDKVRLKGDWGNFRMNPTHPDDFTVYLKNNTTEEIIIDRNSILGPHAWYIFILEIQETLYLSNGVEFTLNNEGIGVFDPHQIICGLGMDERHQLNIPIQISAAFLIEATGEGDSGI